MLDVTALGEDRIVEAGDVAGGEDAGRARPQQFIDDDAAFLKLDAAALKELRGRRNPNGCHDKLAWQAASGHGLHFLNPALAMERCGGVVQHDRRPAFFDVPPEILGNHRGFEARKNGFAALDDGDMKTEVDQRYGDFHAEKAGAEDDSPLRSCGGEANRLGVDLAPQAVDAASVAPGTDSCIGVIPVATRSRPYPICSPRSVVTNCPAGSTAITRVFSSRPIA